MRYIAHIAFCLLTIITASCSKSDSPEYPVFMQPSSIVSNDPDGGSQTFNYDDYGRIVEWTVKYADSGVYARYFYPDDNTIRIVSEEYDLDIRTYREELIQLVNGRASKSEGTFMRRREGDSPELEKTYRLEFEYDPANHLATVRHSEVVGIGDDIPTNAWNKPWSWEDYLIWKDGNLIEFLDYQGKSFVYQTIRYDYSAYAVEYPVIIPNVIGVLHDGPLYMQGIFGLNSNNLLSSLSVFDKGDNIGLSRQYTYEFDDARISDYAEKIIHNTSSTSTISYKVNWTTK